jgi:hypothetical protein
MRYRDCEKMIPWLLLALAIMGLASWVLSLFGIDWPSPP